MLKKSMFLGLLVNAVFSMPPLLAQNNNEYLGNNDDPMVAQHLGIFYDKLQKSELWSRAKEDIEIRLARHQPLDTRNEDIQRFNHEKCESAVYPSEVLEWTEKDLPGDAAITSAIYTSISREKFIKLASIGAAIAQINLLDSMWGSSRARSIRGKGERAKKKRLKIQQEETEQKNLDLARYQESLNLKMDLSIRQVTDEEFNEELFFKVRSIACYLPLPLQSFSAEEREKFIETESARSLRILEAIEKSR